MNYIISAFPIVVNVEVAYVGKHSINMLLSLTMILCAFLSGFFFGRYYNDAPIQVSTLTSVPETAAPVQINEASLADTESTVADTEAPTLPSEPESTNPSGRININTATAAQLETLPGIGEVIAQRIIDYRNTHGPFQSVYALTNVKGIGEKRLSALLDLITV